MDNFLTNEALTLLYNYCLESTVFFDVRESYLGTYLKTGFQGDLVIQIAEELNWRFPRIFNDHFWNTAWAYKYENSLKGIKIHADESAVNVNFWIAPDEGNLDKSSGGLVVYPVEAPLSWNFNEFNSEDKIQVLEQFIKDSRVPPVTIPHKRNRMVLQLFITFSKL